MNLLVDAGNTNIKMVLSHSGALLDDIITISTNQFSETTLTPIFEKYYPFQQIVVSTVSLPAQIILDSIPHHHSIIVSAQNRLPFDIRYTTPETLGSDRLSAVAGALRLSNDNHILVIDAGSAVTYEYISHRTYWGGNISPGLRLRFESLHRFTTKLPLLSAQQPTHNIGRTTTEAINNGVVLGLIAEIEQAISLFNKNKEKITVFLTGGDAFFLQNLIKSPIFVEPNLTLLGMLEIMKLNTLSS